MSGFHTQPDRVCQCKAPPNSAPKKSKTAHCGGFFMGGGKGGSGFFKRELVATLQRKS
jgi:hypothetical protein